MQTRLITLATFTLFTLCVDICLSADLLCNEDKRPNVGWIMAEDISTELGCFGHPAVKTPSNDGLACHGVRYQLKWEGRDKCHGERAPRVIPEGPVRELIVVKIQ